MATSPEAPEAAARDRILRHMNADHQDSVRRYLEHHIHASAVSVRDAQLTDITLTHIQCRYAGGTKTVTLPFDPPMKSLREARDRLVQMDKAASAALGRHSVTIKSYLAPQGGALIAFTLCLTTLIIFARPANFRPGALLYDRALFMAPDFAAACAKVQPVLISTLVGLHVFEMFLMAKKLTRHSVVPLSKVWCAWMASCFVEGVGSFRRMDAYVKMEAAKKH